jgi:hypothetical protein
LLDASTVGQASSEPAAGTVPAAGAVTVCDGGVLNFMFFFLVYGAVLGSTQFYKSS